jgi:GTP-binding protein Era
VQVSLEDADVILLVVEPEDKYDEQIHDRFQGLSVPVILAINKSDLTKGSQIEDKLEYWKSKLKFAEAIGVSAKTGKGIEAVLPLIKKYLPEHPAYFPKDTLTDRYERFFAAEMIREKIFLYYDQEIPYSCEVGIESFKDETQIIRIAAMIYVERDSQKGIVIGKAGSSLKKVGMEARKDMEKFFGKKIFLETRVKVAENWRKQKTRLRQFGYLE